MTTEPDTAAPLSERQLRWLKRAVIVMGILLVAGFIVIVARIVYLIANQPVAAEVPAAALARDAALPLPAGAVVRQVSLSGNRVAIHYDTPTGGAIAVVDLVSGRIVSRLTLPPVAGGR